MLSKNSAPEKKKRFIFWSLLALYVSLIFFFTPNAYPALKFIMDKTKLNLNLGMSLLGIFMFIYFYLALIKTKNLRTVKVSLILSCIVMGYIILFVIFTKNPVERFHLFEYGVLSYFIYQALDIDLHEENLYGWGMIIVLLVSSLDELFQVPLPHRFGDIKDIFNEPPRSKLRGIPKIIQSTSSFPDLIGESRNKETGFSGQARE